MELQRFIDYLAIFCRRNDCEIERVTIVTKTRRDRAMFKMGMMQELKPHLSTMPLGEPSDIDETTINGVTVRVL